MSCLNTLDINPLSFISFANIFSHLVGCLFLLLMVSFVVQKLLSLIRSHLFTFAFISITLGDGSPKILLQFMSKSVLPVFLSEFYGIWSYIQIFNPFEFIFVYGFRECPNFILLHVAVQFSEHHLFEETVFCILYSCLLCGRLIEHEYLDFFIGSLSCSIDLCVSFCQCHTVSITAACSIVPREHDSSSSVLSQDCFAIRGPLCFHTN